MSWDDFWKLYDQCSEDDKRLLLEQIDLSNLIKNASQKVKKEVLKNAPRELAHSLNLTSENDYYAAAIAHTEYYAALRIAANGE